MQMDKASKLRKSSDSEICPHESIDKEYHKGAATGDYVCKKCGEARSGNNWNQKLEKNG